MARLIDADELMKKFYDIEFNAKHELFGESRDLALEGLKHIKKALKGMPTIDPVKHGRWIEAAGGRTICNQCGEYPLYDYFGRQKRTKACPSCMAVMDLPEQAEEAYRGDQ